MNELIDGWLAESKGALSYRGMYDLARRITEAAQELHTAEAAIRVVQSLEDVIDLPVADSSLLKRARHTFLALANHLAAESAIPRSSGDAGGDEVSEASAQASSNVDGALAQESNQDLLQTKQVLYR